MMNSKDKISLAALKIFLQKGYDATSISDVVAECKITKGGIYHHFKNKEELFIETIDYLFDRFEELERTMYSESENFKQILQTYFGSLSNMSEVLGAMTGSENIDVSKGNFGIWHSLHIEVLKSSSPRRTLSCFSLSLGRT